MNILMTGTEGMIGSRLCKWLESKHTITQFEGDIIQWIDWQKYLDQRFDMIIHLAALAGVRPSFEDPEGYFEANVTGSLNAFTYGRMNCKRMLYASSSNAYDWTGNPYATTKKMNEVQGAIMVGLPNIGMRFHTVWPGRDDMLFKKLQRGQVTYINDNHSRDFIHIEDLCKAIDLLIDNFLAVYKNQKVVDIGTGEAISVSAVAKSMGYQGQYVSENPVGERIHTKANIAWLKELGWEAQRDILNKKDHIDVPQC